MRGTKSESAGVRLLGYTYKLANDPQGSLSPWGSSSLPARVIYSFTSLLHTELELTVILLPFQILHFLNCRVLLQTSVDPKFSQSYWSRWVESEVSTPGGSTLGYSSSGATGAPVLREQEPGSPLPKVRSPAAGLTLLSSRRLQGRAETQGQTQNSPGLGQGATG